MLRRRNGREALNDPLDDESDVLVSSDEQAMDAQRDVAKLLVQLPDRQRLPIQYVKLDGLSVVEAARLTGMSKSAVKVGVHRALKALAEIMRGKQ
jgi:RNA polymerase sigma-70 factor (ECF subfamily)